MGVYIKWFKGAQENEIGIEYRYENLGALFTSRLSFNEVQQDLAQKARVASIQVNGYLFKKVVPVPPYICIFQAV